MLDWMPSEFLGLVWWHIWQAATDVDDQNSCRFIFVFIIRIQISLRRLKEHNIYLCVTCLYLMAEVSLAVLSDSMLMAPSSSPSKPCKYKAGENKPDIRSSAYVFFCLSPWCSSGVSPHPPGLCKCPAPPEPTRPPLEMDCNTSAVTNLHTSSPYCFHIGAGGVTSFTDDCPVLLISVLPKEK